MAVVSRTYIRNGEHYECHQRNGYTFLDTNFRLCRPRFLHRPKSAVAQLTLFTPPPPMSGNLCSGSVVWRFFGRNLRNFQSVLHIIVHEINREEKVQLPCCTVSVSVWHWSNQPSRSTETINNTIEATPLKSLLFINY